MSHPKVLSFVLAGGKGERLFPLTVMRSKPAVPFGGKFRIIDFVLSNHINSHIYSIYLLIQYKSQSLIEHVRKNWVLSPVVQDHFIALVPPQMRMGPEWFQGTADAVFQNVALIKQHNPELVIVFGADHVYRMDIRQMIDFHLSRDADVTVAARPVSLKECSKFGIMVVDKDMRIKDFQEKPKKGTPMPNDPTRALGSMGNYIFRRDVLLDALAAAKRKQLHDFGSHIIPAILDSKRVFAYDFESNIIPGVQPYEEAGYWRDVGTIASFYDAHMDMLGPEPRLDLNNPSWPIHSSSVGGPGAVLLGANVKNSLVADGVRIEGGRVRNSVIRSGVTIEKDVHIENSIIMDGSIIKRGAKLKKVIVDKNNVVEEGEQLGFDHEADRFRCFIDQSRISVLPREGKKRRKMS